MGYSLTDVSQCAIYANVGSGSTEMSIVPNNFFFESTISSICLMDYRLTPPTTPPHPDPTPNPSTPTLSINRVINGSDNE